MSLLFAICGEKHNLLSKHVPLNRAAQNAVKATFLAQESDFRREIERPFDQNWKPEQNEVMTVDVPQDVTVFKQICQTEETSFEPINTNNFEAEGIRALAIKRDESILVQTFDLRQSLTQKRTALLYRDETFTQLEDPAFHLGKDLVCIVEDGLIKFRNLHNLGRIIHTSTIFKEATDSEVVEFAQNNLHLFDIQEHDVFVQNANRDARKHIKSIIDNRILEQRNPQAIIRRARETGLSIHVRRNKIAMPESGTEIFELMRFLNEGRYLGPISGKTYITNSRRPVGT